MIGSNLNITKTAYVHVPYLTGKAPVKVQPAVKVEKQRKFKIS